MEGTRKGRAVAQATMEEVRPAMKISYKFDPRRARVRAQ